MRRDPVAGRLRGARGWGSASISACLRTRLRQLARDRKAVESHDRFAYLNFPEEWTLGPTASSARPPTSNDAPRRRRTGPSTARA